MNKLLSYHLALQMIAYQYLYNQISSIEYSHKTMVVAWKIEQSRADAINNNVYGQWIYANNQAYADAIELSTEHNKPGLGM
jgi:hypothetical protein